MRDARILKGNLLLGQPYGWGKCTETWISFYIVLKGTVIPERLAYDYPKNAVGPIKYYIQEFLL